MARSRDILQNSFQRTKKILTSAGHNPARLNDIVNEIEKLTTLNIEISNASKEQAQGVTAINASIMELDKVTQDNASAANSCATAAEELNEQSQHLHHMVQSLVSVIEGNDAA